jgi:hypothetical protein
MGFQPMVRVFTHFSRRLNKQSRERESSGSTFAGAIAVSAAPKRAEYARHGLEAHAT